MVSGKIVNDPNDNFADSKGAQNTTFVIFLMIMSFIVSALCLAWLVYDSHLTRKAQVLAHVVLFISAVLMVAGGDFVMIIDIFLSLYFGYETHKYFKHKTYDLNPQMVPLDAKGDKVIELEAQK